MILNAIYLVEVCREFPFPSVHNKSKNMNYLQFTIDAHVTPSLVQASVTVDWEHADYQCILGT